MTPDEIRSLGASTDIVTAGRAFGIGRALAYDLVRRGQFPVPVLRLGARIHRVRTADILRELGYDPEPTASSR